MEEGEEGERRQRGGRKEGGGKRRENGGRDGGAGRERHASPDALIFKKLTPELRNFFKTNPVSYFSYP
jgi:hypothetical protein